MTSGARTTRSARAPGDARKDHATARRGPAAKRYDAAYFEHWYRRSSVGVGQRAFVERKVRLALSAAEYVMGRPARSVLDVGCGEAPWRAILRRLRPGITYRGFDSSAYAVSRHGRRRGIVRAGLAQMGAQGLRGRFDLVVCADVLHYVTTAEVRAGLAAIAPRVRGVAFLEAFALEDEIDGDREQLQSRPAAAYRRLFAESGLVPIGLHLYVRRAVYDQLVSLERAER